MSSVPAQQQLLEEILCPYCQSGEYKHWASENGFSAVRCQHCRLLYVNPRPRQDSIDAAVKTGHHKDIEGGFTVVAKRNPSKVNSYANEFRNILSDVWESGVPVSILDVGAGYGEVVEAFVSLAPAGSRVEGIEPMTPKVEVARRSGLKVREAYITDVQDKYDIVTLINILSHIPDFREFLEELKTVIKPGGELIIETGNVAELDRAADVPSELNLPDHLVFAAEDHCVGFLKDAGFDVIGVHRKRKDGFLRFGKTLVKKAMGRNITLQLPYHSAYRALFIRAKLVD